MKLVNRRQFVKGMTVAGLVSVIPATVKPRARRAAPPMTFKRFHPSITSEPDPAGLVRLIRTYATPEITNQHTLYNGAHGVGVGVDPGGVQVHGFGVPPGRGEVFFTWHRNYIQGLEHSLPPGRVLPSWAPWERIPDAFLSSPPAGRKEVPGGRPIEPVLPNAGERLSERLRTIHQPPVGPEAFAQWSHEVIGFWPAPPDGMGVALSWGPHFAVHALCGGDMAIVDTAAREPIFWPWHTFIDDIYQDWLETKKLYPGEPPPPKGWPWGDLQPPRAPNLGSNDAVAKTPWCMGLTRTEARQKIQQAGLQVGNEEDFHHDSDRVVNQSPLPWTEQKRGEGKVDISAKLESQSGESPHWHPPSF